MGFSVDVSRLDNRCHTPSAAVLHRGSERDAALNDFCVPVNAYFPTPEMLRQLHAKLEHVLKYYPDENRNIAEVVAENFDLEPGNVVMGNGSTELIAWIHRVWEMKRLMTPVPTFGRWTDYPLENGTCVQFHQRREDELFQLNVDRLLAETRALGCTAVAICNPNNPTGRLTDRNRLLELLDRLADLELIVIDESFLDFAGIDDVPTMIHEAVKRSNVIVLKSLGKNFGLHGMRAGYAVTNPHWAEKLRRAVPAWNVNAVAELIIRSGFEQQDAYQASREATIVDRNYLRFQLEQFDQLTVFPSEANFVFVKLAEELDGIQIRNRLLREFGVLIRECGSKFGSTSQYYRIAARPKRDCDQLAAAFRKVLATLNSNTRQEPRISSHLLG